MSNFAAAFLAAAALSMSPLTTAGVPAGATDLTTVTTEGAAIAFGDFAFPVEAGESLTLRRYVLDRGEVVDWGAEPGTVLGLVQSGRMSNVLGCSQAQLWRSPVGYYLPRSEAAGTLGGVTVNDGDEQAVILAVVSGAVGPAQWDDQKHRHGADEVDRPRAVEGCPSGPAAEVEHLAEVRTGTTAAFDQVDHNQIVVYRHRLAPGSSSGWHELPDAGLIVQADGSTTVWTGCDERVTYEPGRAYVHDAASRPRLVTNPGTDVAEYFLVAFDVPANHPADVPRIIPAPPPSGCPQSTLTY